MAASAARRFAGLESDAILRFTARLRHMLRRTPTSASPEVSVAESGERRPQRRRNSHCSRLSFMPTGHTRMHSKHCATLSL